MDVSRLLAALLVGLAGYAAARRFGGGWVGRFTRILFYYVIPPTIFMAVASAPAANILLILVAVSCIHMALLLTPLLALSSREPSRTTMALLSGLPNVVFLAFPLSIALYGTVTPVLPYAIALNMLLPVLLAVLGSWYGGDADAPSAYPHIAAFTAALIVKLFAPGLASTIASIEPLHALLSAANLSAFAAIGGELAGCSHILEPGVERVAFLRLVASPLLMLALLTPLSMLVKLPHVMIAGMLIQSVMPPAVANVILARVYGLDSRLAASSIAVLTPASLVLAVAVAMA